MKDKSHLFVTLAIGIVFLSVLVLVKDNITTAGLSNTAGILNSAITASPAPDPNLEKQILEIQQGTDYLIRNGTFSGITARLAKKENNLTRETLENRAIRVSEKRRDLMIDIAKNHPKEFFRLAIKKTTRAGLIPSVQTHIEDDTIVSGNLEVLHIDDLDDHTHSEFKYTLNQNGEKYEVLSVDLLPAAGSEPVSISGYKIGKVVVIHGSKKIIPVARQGKEALGNQRILVLLTEMQGETSTVSISEVEQVVFSPNSSFEKYYKGQSYNKTWFTGDVYKMQLARPADQGSCGSGVQLMDSDVLLFIKTQNINLGKYDRVLFVPSIGYCSGVGKWDHFVDGSNYKMSESWVGWYDFRYSIDANKLGGTLAHEIGHALGVMHANFLLCDRDDECINQEYGNYFDVMGTGAYGGGHFNAFYKEQLGWLTPPDFVNIVTSGNYTINFLESFTGKKAAKIVNPLIGPLSLLYLEKRDIVHGWDPYMDVQRNKLLLNMPQRPSDITRSDIWLIDMKPGTPPGDPYTDKENVSLDEGEQYTLASYGLTVGPVSPAGASTSFRVDLSTPVCTSVAPRIDAYGGHPVAAGGSTYLGVFLFNLDPVCAVPSSYVLEFTNLPLGWIIEDKGGDSGLRVDNVAPRTFAYLTAGILISPTTPSGSYTLNYRIRNITSGISTEKSFDVSVFPKPRIISILPEELHSGSSMTIQTNYQIDTGNGDKNAPGYYLNFDGPDYFYLSGGLPASGTIQKTVPTQLDDTNSWCSNPCVPRPLPPGIYNVTLYAFNSQSDVYPIGIDLDLHPTQLNSVSPNPAQSNQQVVIGGTGFAPVGNILTLMNFGKTGPPDTSKIVPSTNNGTTIQFIPDVPVGDYYVQVTNPTKSNGVSNLVVLTITPMVSTSSVTITASVDGLPVSLKDNDTCLASLSTPLGNSLVNCVGKVTSIRVPIECTVSDTNAATSILSLKAPTCGYTEKDLVSGIYSLAWSQGTYPAFSDRTTRPNITPSTNQFLKNGGSLVFNLDFRGVSGGAGGGGSGESGSLQRSSDQPANSPAPATSIPTESFFIETSNVLDAIKSLFGF